jgi:hypothetical protein
LLRFFPPRIGFSGIKKETPHRRIAETTIALDASLHSTAKISNGKLSNGKLPTAREPMSRFPNFPMGFVRRANRA